MPARPMYHSPHKKVNGWARGYVPEFGKQSGSTSGHGGNIPPGKVKKMSRVKTGPAGTPQGVHVKDPRPGDMCFCGGCYEKNNGYEKLVR